MRRRAAPPRAVALAFPLAALAATIGLAGCGSPRAVSSSPAAGTSGATTTQGAPTTGSEPSGAATSPVPASTVVATAHGAIPRFASPGGPEDGTVPATWFSAPSILPVIATRPGWVQVRLAQRPNESTTWVLASDVTLATTPYGIVIDLASRQLTLYQDAKAVFSAPVGIGTATYPTPPGHYFVAFFAAPPNPGYGAFVIVTSDHSDTITDWEQSGDALIAIHGPLGSDADIGTTGAAVSHGCIRMHEPDLLRLRQVPAGSPVEILH
jgi:lipoprotein-anchoring transpeptidase ErfK/SrfK